MEGTREEILKHYGVIRRSGRYPYGSGGNAYQSAKDFKAHLDDMRNDGLSNAQIAEALGIKTPELRDSISLAKEIIYSENTSMATRLKNEKQMSTRAIAERMLGDKRKESTVRGWLASSEKVKDDTLASIANLLKGHLGTKRWLDVGEGTELHMGISKVKLRAAIQDLKNEGYKTYSVKLPQLGTDKLTEYKIVGQSDTTWGEAKDALLSGNVYTVVDKSTDGGLNFMTPKPEPVSLNSKRIQVRYAEDGGSEMDGVLELRRGVSDLDLGANRYAQVRVAVDGTHYLKGMAMYADDLPPGVDVRFNTNKKKANAPSKLAVMKELRTGVENANNRFGAITYPQVYTDSKGKEQTSPLNLVYEEGNWDKWSKSLSSQVLSKQSITLASTQLAKAAKQEREALDKIMTLTNPIVKKQLLLDYATKADAKAVKLKAASLPRQATQVLLPMNSMRPNEVYAPQYEHGERVALIRHPHSGPFEIPELTVNNNNRTAKRLMGQATDAIGIHHSVAEKLSGADFDGDAVLVIPNNSKRIKSRETLTELENFNPKEAYPEVPGMKYMEKHNVQREMGTVSNLITDMTIKGASSDEIAKAVKHSMVVIDAENHKLNYKQSEKDNGIAMLKARYQKDPENPRKRGASTLISRASSEARIPQIRPRRQSEGGPINPDTGELEYVETGKTRTITTTNQRTGETTTKTVPVTTKGTQLGLAKDAYTLSSGEPMESVYANYSNTMKALANEARKEYTSIKDPKYSVAAKAVYAKEVASLTNKLKEAQMNAPLERRAQSVANATARAVIDANPQLDKDQVKRVKYEALSDARTNVGAGKDRIGSDTNPITEREWAAIQAGAVPSTKLKDILLNSDMKVVQQLATPTTRTSSLTTGQIALAKSMANSGRSLTEIASALGIPRSTIADNIKAN